MKIKCTCDHIIIDQTDFLNYKGYIISDKHWFDFWDQIDDAIENPGKTDKEKDKTCMMLRKLNLFKTIWECSKCGKLFVDGEHGNLTTYTPDNKLYNHVLDVK